MAAFTEAAMVSDDVQTDGHQYAPLRSIGS